MDKKQYFDSVLNYIDNLTDEEFDAILIESGLEECPYEDFTKKSESKQYKSYIMSTNSFKISSLENFNIFNVGVDAA